jgi:hypothetical protein
MTTEAIQDAAPDIGPAVVANTGIEFSENLSNIAKALIRAQLSMDEIFKDSTNPHFRSKYAALPACLNAVKPALLANGIALLQPPSSSADGTVVFVSTMFLHESGEWMRTRLGLIPVKDDPQGAGSAITYGRRYTLLGMCGVAPEEDDDGNAASRSAVRRPTASRSTQAPSAPPEPKETAKNGAAAGWTLDTPGGATEATLKGLSKWLAIMAGDLDFTVADERRMFWDATKGRTEEPDLSLLSENEGRRLAKALKPLVDARPTP